MKKEDEIILAAKRALVFDNEKDHFQGSKFKNEDPELFNRVVNAISENYKSIRRGSVTETDLEVSECAELNKDYKQPIPYIVIKKGDKYFATERLSGAGEARLHGKISMGIGGHMNPIVGHENFDELLKENTLRELNEELTVKDNGLPINIEMLGLINDDENEVGEVHIGLLGQIVLDESQDVEVLEVEQLKGSWHTLDELLEEETFSRVEAWGKIVIVAVMAGKVK